MTGTMSPFARMKTPSAHHDYVENPDIGIVNDCRYVPGRLTKQIDGIGYERNYTV